ncbi:choice-of-anchor D domain-containing protein, partial [Thioalkalivibrio sp.]|uniref:choice-of-anchor D domain-containing protein n=1 Tax=Thioalkalivibrio sp. TaxID=2093813 RepID=UPI0035694AF3
MTFKFGKTERLVVALLAGSIGLLGCGGSSSNGNLGGGGGGGGTSDAAITVSPTNFDFAAVTDGNLEGLRPGIFTLSNAGEISYNISNITLEGDGSTAFELDETGDNATCNKPPFTLEPGESCTVAVSFDPQSFGIFTAALSVFNNEPPGFVTSRITGTFADIEEINVTVNQI